MVQALVNSAPVPQRAKTICPHILYRTMLHMSATRPGDIPYYAEPQAGSGRYTSPECTLALLIAATDHTLGPARSCDTDSPLYRSPLPFVLII